MSGAASSCKAELQYMDMGIAVNAGFAKAKTLSYTNPNIDTTSYGYSRDPTSFSTLTSTVVDTAYVQQSVINMFSTINVLYVDQLNVSFASSTSSLEHLRRMVLTEKSGICSVQTLQLLQKMTFIAGV
jgi:hypothetical protein